MPKSRGHPPLDLGQRQIRLLRIESDGGSIIACQLECFLLDEPYCPKFTALSYRWGSPRETQLIELQGLEFQIRSNLAAFLRETKRQGSEWKDLYWIDALCIDQSNVNEKNHQVDLMAWIYYKAEKVVVWLGEGDNQHQYALNWAASPWSTGPA